MSWIEDIDFMCPWLMNNLPAVVQPVKAPVNGLKECQALRMLRQIKNFLVNHPVISVFLALLVGFVFLPLLVFLTFVSSSFVVVSVSALTVLGGTFMMALFSFLVVLSPALVFGGILAILIYLLLCFVMKVLQTMKILKYKYIVASRRLRNHRRRRLRRESVPFVGLQVGQAGLPIECEHSLINTSSWRGLVQGAGIPALSGQFSHLSY